MTSVSMILRTAEHNVALEEAFIRNALGYGGKPYMGLLSPTSTLIPESAVAKLQEHLRAVDAWCTGVVNVYRDLLNGHDHDKHLLRAMEWGLSDYARQLQRASALRGDRPVAGRLDCVDLGSDNFVAEVQWKGAGEGFAAAIERSYREVFPLEAGHRGLGDLVEAWARYFATDGCAVNTGRVGWMDSEVFLVRELARRGTTLASFAPGDVQQALAFAGGQPVVDFEGRRSPMRHLYLDRLTEVIDRDLLDRLVSAYVDRSLVIDPPPSYLFNQKLPLSLPFDGPFCDCFDPSVRRALIPTIWLSAAAPDLAPLVTFVQHPHAERLLSLTGWDEVCALPEELRGQLVLKCGSAHRDNNYGGYGVYRLNGTADVARDTLNCVLRRVLETGEPWVVQPYLGRTWRLPIALQSRPDDMGYADMHAKFVIYFQLPGDGRPTVELLGGVANLGTSWKVSGASKTSARNDESGHLTGAFRHDIRVEVGK